jgi:hypothetical protein
MPLRTLIPVENFNTDNIVFSKPETNTVPGQKISYKRIRLNYKQGDDLHDLILESPPDLLSWGLAEQHDMVTSQLTGYQLPICLWSKNGPSSTERLFTDTIDKICEYTKKYLVDHKDEIEMYNLDLSDLKRFNPLYWKTEKGKILEERGPTLYAKCLYNKTDQKINTIFINEDLRNNVNPLSILDKQCFVKFALRIESIFFGTKISLQVKLHEVLFRPKERILHSLLCPDAEIKDVDEEETVIEDQHVEECEAEEEVDDSEGEEDLVETEVVQSSAEKIVVEEVKPIETKEKKRIVGRRKKESLAVVS